MNDAEKAHWRSVGYFFCAYKYFKMLSLYGDLPWVEHALSEDSEELYSPCLLYTSIVNAHGACIVEENGRYYLFGEWKSDKSNTFPGFHSPKR